MFQGGRYACDGFAILDKHGCLTRLRGVLSEMARQRIVSGWQGVFRAVVLELLPVKPLAEDFSPDRRLSNEGVAFDGEAGVSGRLLWRERGGGG